MGGIFRAELKRAEVSVKPWTNERHHAANKAGGTMWSVLCKVNCRSVLVKALEIAGKRYRRGGNPRASDHPLGCPSAFLFTTTRFSCRGM